jgi:ATP-dependent DNA ligase
MQKMPAPLRFIAPMECLPVGTISGGAEWQYELMLDGYRAIAEGDPDLVACDEQGKPYAARYDAVTGTERRLAFAQCHHRMYARCPYRWHIARARRHEPE